MSGRGGDDRCSNNAACRLNTALGVMQLDWRNEPHGLTITTLTWWMD